MTRGLPVMIVGVALLLALAPPSSDATTWTLRPDGSGDFPTIQSAIAAAEDGDELLLEDGIYTRDGDTIVDFAGKAITIRSASGNADACVIDGDDVRQVGAIFQSAEGPASVLADLTFARSASSVQVIDIAGSSPTLRNVTVRDFRRTAIRTSNGSPRLEDLILCEGGSPTFRCDGGAPVLSGCLLEAISLMNSRGGIELSRADVTFEDCTIRDFRMADHSSALPLSTWESTTTFRRCEIRDNDGSGVHISGGTQAATVLFEDCVIRDNTVGIRADSYYQRPVIQVTIRRCLIAGNTGRGVQVVPRARLVVEDSTIEDNGIGLYGSAETGFPLGWFIVRNSIVRSNRTAGIWCGYEAPEIEGCRIQGNGNHPGGAGLILANALDGVLRECLITGNAAGMIVRDGTYTLDHCTIASNGMSDPGGGIRVRYESTLALRNSIVSDNCADDESQILVEDGSLLEVECAALDLSRIAGDGTVLVTGDVLQQDPLLCGPARCSEIPTTAGVYRFAFHSPADRFGCDLGALPAGCGINTGVGSAIESLSWGRIKSRHR